MTQRAPDERREYWEGYRTQALHYLENATEMLERQEWEKAAELLWGAFAEAVKAVAVSNDHLLRSHAEVRRFASELAKERSDQELSNTLARAERLHADFYDRFLDPKDVAEDSEAVRTAVRKLLDLSTPRP